MKHKTHFLYYLFRPRGWIFFALLFCNALLIAQESTPPEEFTIGSNLSGLPWRRTVQNYYESFDSSGMNAVFQYADGNTQPYLHNYTNIIGNNYAIGDWITYYATCYYTRWESEENQTDPLRVGVKHVGGDKTFWDDAWCWSTRNLTVPACSLVYGPHYRQDNRYKSWAHDPDRHNVNFFVRFRMALANSINEDPNRQVCKIKVVYRYAKINSSVPGDYIVKDTVFLERTLTVGDFPTNEKLQYFDFNGASYKYPVHFQLPKYPDKEDPLEDGYPKYEDSQSNQGIQFWVDWLVDNQERSSLNLYVDHVEVFDRDWITYIDEPQEVVDSIQAYAERHLNSNWSNLKYWSGHDEPYSIDAFTPIKIVDQILKDANAPQLLNIFNPYWSSDEKINGDTLLCQYVRMANPEKLVIDYYPFSPSYPFRYDDAEALRFRFQLCSQLQPGFWYMGQGFGESYWNGNQWVPWVDRYPDSSELKASVMLALAHGSKGILFFCYDSWSYNAQIYGGGDVLHYIQGLVDTLQGDTIPVNDLWYLVRDNLAPRLKGRLGKTLMILDYNGDYINKECSSCPSDDDPEFDYLKIDCNVSNYFWHCGFFKHKDFPDNKHFLLTNLRTTVPVATNLIVLNNTDHKNVSFKDIEGGVGRVDTTIGINSSITYNETMPAGEGRLYRVAPVVKYGGRLIYSDSVSSGTILNDDMIIENGAVLTINGVYSSKGNITIKSGGIINGSNGKIQFVEGKKLIIEGSGSITGTVGNKLDLTFSGSQNEFISGIMIKPGGSLTISNCKIEDATIGIESSLNANYLYAQAVDFINCGTHSISIAGRSPGPSLTPPPQIKNCTMQNSDYGISVTNLPGILIQDNIITNTDCGIYMSNVTDAQVINNFIQSNKEELEGIILLSSGGAIRANYISGHTVGIHLANSSPILGSNKMTLNKYHGLYIGDGSLPYMRLGQWVGRPPNMYATSGYNKIYNNGGYEEEGSPEDNDGSEIYFNNSNALMSKGCNSIYDVREPSPPLINTLLLMNCPAEGHPIYVDARGNYWGNRVSPDRFGNLRVDYIPYSEEPCLEPQSANDELVRMTSFGDVIDTIYSVDVELPELTETEAAYAEAEEYFLTGDLTNALQIYEGIINSNVTEEEKYFAFERKYEIGKLTGQTTEFFNEMSNSFLTLATNTQDTLNAKILNQLSTLSKVGEQEYETAIGEFDGIIQQNPNTEEAVYAEIDALTTSLLIEEADSTLHKGRLGKYLVKTSGDYNQRVDEILRKNFGGKSKETEEELLPTEYTLYQNYPNPFNPVTTIKYDLPSASEVSLIIYDILGRKVKELVNTKQQAGRYEIQFNASNLSSGVYLYQIIADKFISSRKMILLK